jgi:hypothetical protein
MMRWRSVIFVLLGWVVAVGLACSQAQSTPTAIAPPAQGVPETPLSATVDAIAHVPPASLALPPRGDVRLAVISDLNGPYGSTDYDPEVDRAIQLLPAWQPDLVLCSGDMIAGQRLSLSPAEIRAMWAAFETRIAAPLRSLGLPFGFTVGNHDASAARDASGRFIFQGERDLARAYWEQPNHDLGLSFYNRDDFPFYYSFIQNDIFFLVWDGSSSQIPADKLAWVEQQLASPAAQQAKLRMLIGHLPLYAVAEGRNHPGEVMNNADQLRQMMERYDVHAYISGHHHAYYPAHKGNLQLLHTGLLGSGPRALIGESERSPKSLTIVDIVFDAPEKTVYTTYNIQTLAQIDPRQLPRLLLGHNGMVMRRDVAWTDLTPAERARCEQQLGQRLCAS